MKLNKLIISTALVVAGAALFQTSAQASNSDVILGFQTGSAGDTGNGTNILFDLGTVSSYVGLTAGTVINETGFSASDLSAFGTTPTDLYFGAIGAAGSTKVAVSDPTTATTPTEKSSDSAAVGAANNLASEYGDGTALSGTGVSVSSGDTYSFTNINGISGTFGGFMNNNDQTKYTSTGSDLLDLYEFSPSSSAAPATLLGYFTLSGGDALSFTAGAPIVAPEPSSWAMGLAGLAVLGFMLRRRALQS